MNKFSFGLLLLLTPVLSFAQSSGTTPNNSVDLLSGADENIGVSIDGSVKKPLIETNVISGPQAPMPSKPMLATSVAAASGEVQQSPKDSSRQWSYKNTPLRVILMDVSVAAGKGLPLLNVDPRFRVDLNKKATPSAMLDLLKEKYNLTVEDDGPRLRIRQAILPLPAEPSPTVAEVVNNQAVQTSQSTSSAELVTKVYPFNENDNSNARTLAKQLLSPLGEIVFADGTATLTDVPESQAKMRRLSQQLLMEAERKNSQHAVAVQSAVRQESASSVPASQVVRFVSGSECSCSKLSANEAPVITANPHPATQPIAIVANSPQHAAIGNNASTQPQASSFDSPASTNTNIDDGRQSLIDELENIKTALRLRHNDL